MQKNKNLVKAINRNVRSSPRKINLLLKNIRGKKADIAIRDLSFARQRIAFDIKKTERLLQLDYLELFQIFDHHILLFYVIV